MLKNLSLSCLIGGFEDSTLTLNVKSFVIKPSKIAVLIALVINLFNLLSWSWLKLSLKLVKNNWYSFLVILSNGLSLK